MKNLWYFSALFVILFAMTIFEVYVFNVDAIPLYNIYSITKFLYFIILCFMSTYSIWEIRKVLRQSSYKVKYHFLKIQVIFYIVFVLVFVSMSQNFYPFHGYGYTEYTAYVKFISTLIHYTTPMLYTIDSLPFLLACATGVSRVYAKKTSQKAMNFETM